MSIAKILGYDNAQDISELAAYFSAGRIKTANLPNNIVSITEYNADWLFTNGTTISVDAGTNAFTTTAAHGLVVGDPVEFDANGGVLPAGLSAYNSDAVGGTYYNVATVADTTHFTVTATVGSTTPLDITDAGTGAWRIRKAGLAAIDISGLDLLHDGAYEIDSVTQLALISASGSYMSFRPNNDTGCGLSVLDGNNWFPNSSICRGNQTKKYGISSNYMRFIRMSSGLIVGDLCSGGMMSDTKGTSVNDLSAAPKNFSIINLAAELTSVRLYPRTAANALIRNGATVIVRRIN